MKTKIILTTAVASLAFGSIAQAAEQKGSLLTKKAVPAATNPWSASLTSFADFKSVEEKSLHYSLLILGYNFTPTIALNASGSYTGPLHPKPGQEADFEDPELSLDFTVPLNDPNPRNQWTFLGGTMLVIPASRSSTSSNMLVGGGIAAGLSWQSSSWLLRQTNKLYAFSYRLSPSTMIETGPNEPSAAELLDESDSSSSSQTAATAPSSGPGSYVITQHRMEIIDNLTSKLHWKADGWYITDSGAEAPTTQIVRATTRLGYKWTPNFQTMAGLVSQTQIAENQPPLFDYKTMAIRLAILINN